MGKLGITLYIGKYFYLEILMFRIEHFINL